MDGKLRENLMLIVPATGWMPNLTFFPFFLRAMTISARGYWAFATHKPYPEKEESFVFYYTKNLFNFIITDLIFLNPTVHYGFWSPVNCFYAWQIQYEVKAVSGKGELPCKGLLHSLVILVGFVHS